MKPTQEGEGLPSTPVMARRPNRDPFATVMAGMKDARLAGPA
jgi:hypothetical protein